MMANKLTPKVNREYISAHVNINEVTLNASLSSFVSLPR